MDDAPNTEYPTCTKCGARTVKKGKETFGKPPHKRQKWRCTECGYVFTLKPNEEPDGGEITFLGE
jgi:transposase-like protein